MAKKLSKTAKKPIKKHATKQDKKPVKTVAISSPEKDNEVDEYEDKYGPPESTPRFTVLGKLPRKNYEQMLLAVSSGATTQAAAMAVGIHTTTFHNWMRKGREGKIPYKYFYRDILQAASIARQTAETKVQARQPLDWLRNSPMMKALADLDMPTWDKETQVVEGMNISMEQNVNQILRVDDEDTTKAVRIMEELGLITLTEKGRQALLGSSTVIDEPSQHKGNGKP